MQWNELTFDIIDISLIQLKVKKYAAVQIAGLL